MKGAGMTRHTFRAHIHRLISFGLVEVEEKPGEHGGNVYTVYLPEETEPQKTDRGDRGDRGDKVPVVQGSQAHPCDRGINTDISITSGVSKTSFKTDERDDDDEALAGLSKTLRETHLELTGRTLSNAEAERWKEVGEVLMAELRIAAARTTVSNVPAFLAEHLRRRLWKVDKRQARAEGRELPDEAMKVAPAIDAASCPDCAGSGWHYPEGVEKGVRKCKHEKLIKQPTEA
jgi:hypothetical protein